VTGCGYDTLNGQTFDLILNATAASLHNQLPPLPDTALTPNGNCYDLAYGSQPTPFVKWGRQHGAKISTDGIGMLIEQAAEAFLIWRGVRPETESLISDDSLR
jgi:shikimate dehydrogenase